MGFNGDLTINNRDLSVHYGHFSNHSVAARKKKLRTGPRTSAAAMARASASWIAWVTRGWIWFDGGLKGLGDVLGQTWGISLGSLEI
jgi:hypothetical protein